MSLSSKDVGEGWGCELKKIVHEPQSKRTHRSSHNGKSWCSYQNALPGKWNILTKICLDIYFLSRKDILEFLSFEWPVRPGGVEPVIEERLLGTRDRRAGGPKGFPLILTAAGRKTQTETPITHFLVEHEERNENRSLVKRFIKLIKF